MSTIFEKVLTEYDFQYYDINTYMQDEHNSYDFEKRFIMVHNT